MVNFDFRNGPDPVVLLDEGLALDAVGYGAFTAVVFFSGEGDAVSGAAPGSSVAGAFANLDRDENTLGLVVAPIPIPGTASFHCVPEPSTGLLSALGITGVAWLLSRERGKLRRRGRAGNRASGKPIDDHSP